MQIRLRFTALVIPVPLPVDHANILYVDTEENTRERSNKNNKTMKTLPCRERDEINFLWKEKRKVLAEGPNLKKKKWRRTSYNFIFSECISKAKDYGSSCGSLHHVLPLMCANLNLKHGYVKCGDCTQIYCTNQGTEYVKNLCGMSAWLSVVTWSIPQTVECVAVSLC